MSTCPRCARENPPTAWSCAGCGTPLAFGDEPTPARLDAELDLDRRGRVPEPPPGAGEPGAPDDGADGGPGALEAMPESVEVEVGFRPAPPARRVAAWVIDGALVGALGAALPAALLAITGGPPGAPRAGLGMALVLSEAFVGVLAFVYATAAHALGGATLGKRLARIQVVDGDGEPPAIGVSAARSGWAVLSLALAGAGLLPALLSPSRRALHDVLAGTRVVEAA